MTNTPPDADRVFTRRMVRTVLTVAGVAALAAFFWVARRALAIIYISALVAIAVSPLVRRLERPGRLSRRRRRMPHALAILAIYVAFVGVIAVLSLLVLPPLIEQASALSSEIPSLFSRFQTTLIHYGLASRRITLQEAVQQTPTSNATGAINAVLAAGYTLIGGVVGVVTVLILSFYFLLEAESIAGYVMRFVPRARRAGAWSASRQIVVKVSAWMQANVVLGGVMGGASALVLGLAGEPFFYVVALVAALGEIIPMVGPIIAGVLAVGLALSKSTTLALLVGGFFIALHELEANVLVPKIMERRVGVSAGAVMIALLVGWELAGILGAVLAIPSAAIISVALDQFAGEDDLERL
ncbi:MAG TPA: AI-2E family transporter [Vicinamibacterales bacterium]|nr:AI-2E family transporter [Vicinamibacterales bacterium]